MACDRHTETRPEPQPRDGPVGACIVHEDRRDDLCVTDTGNRIGLRTLTYPCRTCQCLWHRTYLQAWDATWMSPTTPKQEPGRAKRCGRVRTCVGCSNPPGSSNSSLLSSDPQIAPQILRLLLRSSDCSSDPQIAPRVLRLLLRSSDCSSDPQIAPQTLRLPNRSLCVPQRFRYCQRWG